MAGENTANSHLTIHLGAIAANWRQIDALAPSSETAAVVKADAYGLGAERVAPHLWLAGARTFFVAQIEEGIALRACLPEARIGVLNGIGAHGVEAFIAHRLTPVLNHRGDIEAWARAGRDQTRPLPGIVHIDTGMNRLGLEAGDIDTLSTDPTRLEGISLTYWMSHLACGAQPDHPLNERQRRAFDEALARLPAAKASLANSPGSLMGAAYHYDLLRPGIALYGGNPSPDGPRGYATSPMRPVVRAEAEIVQVRAGRPGESVGYSAAHVLARPTTIATVAVGYADGYLRAAGDRAPVALRGTRVPVIGRISMDLITVDVTDVPGVPVHVGERVELVGATIALSELSAAAGTIDYEILTGLGARYRRHYTIEAPAQPGEGSGGESDGESAGAPA